MSSVFPTVMPHHERMLAAAKAERERDQKGDALSTAPFDLRFPNQNQTRYCYQSFLDLKRCNRLRGEDYDACKYFKRVVTSMCPKDWVEKWNNQIEEGVFVGKI